MLEKPDLPDQRIILRLQDEYGLSPSQLTFLPLGADVNTAVYRVITAEGMNYFLKLRSGIFDEMSVTIPLLLSANDISAVIVPLLTHDGQGWGTLDEYKMILYPFIEGQDGYQAALTDQHWMDFGTALKRIHSTQVPADLQARIQRESYHPRWRDLVREYQAQVKNAVYDDPIAAKTAALMQANQAKVNYLLERASQLALDPDTRSLPFVLCHSDLHPGNLLIHDPNSLYIVDWDNPIFAPKERDLMFIGAGIGQADGTGKDLFFERYSKGYANANVDQKALAYYRCERIIEDIAAYCGQLLMVIGIIEDREQSYDYLTSQFLPNQVIDIALQTDPSSTHFFKK